MVDDPGAPPADHRAPRAVAARVRGVVAVAEARAEADAGGGEDGAKREEEALSPLGRQEVEHVAHEDEVRAASELCGPARQCARRCASDQGAAGQSELLSPPSSCTRGIGLSATSTSVRMTAGRDALCEM